MHPRPSHKKQCTHSFDPHCITSEIASLALERMELKCQDEIKRDRLAKGPDQGEAWDRAEAEAEAEAGAVVVGQVPAETAFALSVEKELLTRREFPALTRNARSAERLCHGSSPASL
jgi:hypothetical protein